MKLTIFAFVIFSVATCSAQHQFKVTNPSKTVTVSIDVAACDTDCHGAAKFTFARTGEPRAFQTVRLPDTQIWLGDDGKPSANVTLLYDQQSVVNFGDFNFDGQEDVAICDGGDGAYGSPTYRVYLHSPASKRYVYSPAFSALAHDDALGMFEIDAKKKMLMKASKSGCCWHRTQGFSVVSNTPKLVYEFTEDATQNAGETVKIISRKLTAGKWKTSVKRAKTSDYYKN
ncbi:MAG: hypothetical protein ABI878_02770 [Acidobacteriota bacterium]